VDKLRAIVLAERAGVKRIGSEAERIIQTFKWHSSHLQ
jgi:hypothetical protein